MPVQGTVTVNGEPLSHASVIFRPENGRPSIGKTDEEGRYQLQYTRESAGALPGLHEVAISTFVESDPDSSDPIVQLGRRESLPSQYNSHTTLKVELPQDHQADHPLDFALEVEGVQGK
ncbi:MAG: Ig-like domain-containing protein [Planctomycetaceae bacterium]|nr:Ig-like domain-containing protein [Planctomycetaceae bacterium]